MGYSLLNLGRDLVVGGLARNKAITDESKKLRQQELAANRALAMEEVKKDNDSRRKDYDEEIKKFKVVDSLNKKYQGQEGIDREAFGREYLLATNPKHFDSVIKAYAKQPQKLASVFESYGQQGNTSFTVSTTKEALKQKYKEQSEAITANFTKQIKEAKGDDFLVSKALGLRDKLLGKVREEETSGDTIGTNAAVETSNAIKEVSGLETKGDFTFGDTSKKTKITPPKEYQDAFADVKKAAIFKSLSDKDNLSGFIGLSKKLGFGSEMNFKFDNKDSKIVGVGDSANAFLETYKKAYDNILNSYTDINLYDINKNKNSISSVINEQEIKRQVENMMIQRENVLTTGEGFNLTSNKQLMAIIPLNIVDTSNRSMINGKPVSINIPESNKKYNEFLKIKAKSAYGTYEGDIGIRNLIKVQNVLENDKFGNGPLSQELKKVLVIEKPTEDTSKNNVPPKPTQAPKSKIQITSEGLLSDRGLLRWESPQIQNRIDSLTPAQKKAYDEWKAKGGKNNTKTKSLGNPSYMRPAKPDIITPKVKEFMQDTKKTEGEFGSGA